MSAVYSHSGDFGDLVAALPVIKSKGGGRLRLFPAIYTGWRMTQERVATIKPLLELQPYIHGVEWGEGPEGVNLDQWRDHYRSGWNLCDMTCSHFDVPHPPREEPWLTVTPRRMAQVVFARSSRYRPPHFPWPEVYRQYHEQAVFLGLPEEHVAFVREVGPVSYHHTRNLLTVAEIIAAADLVVVNQTCLFWVAEGLKTPTLLEITQDPNNCHWERTGNLHGWSMEWLGKLPTLAELPERRARSDAARKATKNPIHHL